MCNEEKPDVEVQYGGSRRVSGGVGLCESTHTKPLSVSASYGPILPHIPRHHHPHHQICSRATGTGGPGPPHISSFQAGLGLLREKARLVTLWSDIPFLLRQSAPYPSKKEHYPPVLGAEWNMHAHSDTPALLLHSQRHSGQVIHKVECHPKNTVFTSCFY